MHPSSQGDLTAVVMAKAPEPGLVMTRLNVEGGFDPDTAAEMARLMLRCLLRRLVDRLEPAGRVLLAVTPDGHGATVAGRLGLPAIPTIDQGGGDLGERIDRVWRELGEGAVAFFGSDTPDLPDSHLGAVGAALRRDEAVVGPTQDGGYWTLAARRYLPALVSDIDWGGRTVYDQTCQRARQAGVRLGALPTWYDIDQPDDVADLRARLAPYDRRGPGGGAHEGAPADPLGELARQLETLCK